MAVTTLADRSFRIAAVTGPVLHVWDGHSGQEVRALRLPHDRGEAVALAALPDLRVVVAAADGRQTLVYDTESGSEIARLEHKAYGYRGVADLAARPDGGLLLAVGTRSENPDSARSANPARVLRLDPRW